MPELPDVTVYVERLAARVLGGALERIRLASPFVLRTVEPQLSEALGPVRSVGRLGKRIVVEAGCFVVIHLMVAGRLRWARSGAPIPGKIGLAALDFSMGTLLFVESSPKNRASLHLARSLEAFDRDGLEVMDASPAAFAEALRRENHTLKRALTDPRLFSGIGNAYSDEILHRARMSPFVQTSRLGDAEVESLRRAVVEVLEAATARLRAEVGEGWPEKVTAFRPEMAVHGRFGQPCPVCGDPVQRIVYAENEANYCATCQTGGRLLADRALSQLLKQDWPRTLEEMEELKTKKKSP